MENESKPRLSGSIITLVVILALLTGLIGGIIGSYITGLFNNQVTQSKNISWKAVQAPSLSKLTATGAVPRSFADTAEKIIPGVVNINTVTVASADEESEILRRVLPFATPPPP